MTRTDIGSKWMYAKDWMVAIVGFVFSFLREDISTLLWNIVTNNIGFGFAVKKPHSPALRIKETTTWGGEKKEKKRNNSNAYLIWFKCLLSIYFFPTYTAFKAAVLYIYNIYIKLLHMYMYIYMHIEMGLPLSL